MGVGQIEYHGVRDEGHQAGDNGSELGEGRGVDGATAGGLNCLATAVVVASWLSAKTGIQVPHLNDQCISICGPYDSE